MERARVVYRFGQQDGQIRAFLRSRVLIKRVVKALRARVELLCIELLDVHKAFEGS